LEQVSRNLGDWYVVDEEKPGVDSRDAVKHILLFAEMMFAGGRASVTKDHHHHHFYLPNNTTVYTFAWIRFRRAGRQGPIRTLTVALKRSIKTVTGCIYYHTNKIITNEKN